MHKPVLVKEVLEYLHVKKGGKYIDATLGAAGHSLEIVKAGGDLLGIDADPKMLGFAEERLEGYSHKAVLGNFSQVGEIAQKESFTQVDGILFDLGISNVHFLEDSRGFSFSDSEAPLDMRLNLETQAIKAADLVNGLREDQLRDLFEPVLGLSRTRQLVKKLISFREGKEIISVGDFLEAGDFGSRRGKIHPATKAFLALRIAVNSELENLKETLPKAFSLLRIGGRLLIITFHSLEERIVKKFFEEKKDLGEAEVLTENAVKPSEEELKVNPKSRSAKLWVLERI